MLIGALSRFKKKKKENPKKRKKKEKRIMFIGVLVACLHLTSVQAYWYWNLDLIYVNMLLRSDTA